LGLLPKSGNEEKKSIWDKKQRYKPTRKVLKRRGVYRGSRSESKNKRFGLPSDEKEKTDEKEYTPQKRREGM